VVQAAGDPEADEEHDRAIHYGVTVGLVLLRPRDDQLRERPDDAEFGHRYGGHREQQDDDGNTAAPLGE
jgi:hypothetical protein